MKTAIMFRSTSNYYYNVGNLIVNIERFSSAFAEEYIIFTDNEIDDNWQSLKEIGSYYKKQIHIKPYTKEYFFRKTKLELPNNHFFRHYPYLIFSLFEIFNLLDEYDSVLALDVDMFITAGIDEIKDMGPLAFRQARMLNPQMVEPIFYEKCITPNAGCIYVTKDLSDYGLLSNRCYELLTEYFDKIKTTYEETVLGILIQEKKLKYHLMSTLYNRAPGREDSSFSKIVHCIGTNKPWENKEILSCFPEVVRNIKTFNDITNNKYENINLDYALLDEKIKRTFYANYWNLLYSEIADLIPQCYILSNNTKQYFQIFIHGLPREIHYELYVGYNKYCHFLRNTFRECNKSNNIKQVLIQFHIENKSLAYDLKDKVEYIVTRLNGKVGLRISEKMLSVYIRAKTETFIKDITEFMELMDRKIIKILLSDLSRRKKADVTFDVAILGRYNNGNWGGSLTVLSTYSTLEEMGYSTRLLQLQSHNENNDLIYNRLCKFTKIRLNPDELPNAWDRWFENFVLPSDWTLHREWFLPLETRMFLWVDKNVNKVGLSSSFGSMTGGYAEKDYPKISRYLNRFQHLSIRERAGVDLCKKMGVEHAVVMPDPIFSQGKDYYVNISNMYPHTAVAGKYVAVYLLDLDKEQIRLSVEVARRIGFKPVFIVANKDLSEVKKLEGYEYVAGGTEGVSKWIYHLNNAEYVITNSFHGLCLSLILSKKFIIVDRGGAMSLRLAELLGNFGLEKKLVRSDNEIEIALNIPIDVEEVKRKTKQMNDEIRSFIKKSIHKKADAKTSNRVDVLPKMNCTGCMSCVNICPKKCIVAEEDVETGFLYPKIDELSCINCGLCSAACPVLSKKELPKQQNNVYCGFSKDEEIRYNSSSGGFFTELAKAVFAKGNAVVFGAAFETPYVVFHTGIMNEEDISKIRQSKYVQSEMRDTYLKMEIYLREGRNVMFCGTPCQCAAVRSYMSLKKISDENLYLIDFVCHSVNSPKAYAAYLTEIEKTNDDSIKSVWFRNKEDSWRRFSTRIDFVNKQPYYIKNHDEDDFYKGFVKHRLYSRSSCTQCNFRGENRYSDISLADAWGIKMNCDNRYGISTAIVHTPKGQKLFDAIREYIYVEDKTIQDVSKGNRHHMLSPHLNGNSRYFYQRLSQGIPFSKILDEVEKNNFVREEESDNSIKPGQGAV